RWFGLDLRADVREVHTEVVRLGLVARPPDLAQELAVGDELPSVLSEDAQEVELDRRQVDLLPGAGDVAPLQVDDQIPDLDARLPAAVRRPPKHGSQASQELVRPERLRHVIIGAGVERAHLLALVADRREHDDRELAPAPDLAGDVDAAAV